MDALRYVDVRGYSAAIFRRSKVAMRMADAPLSRANEWFRNAEAAGLARWDAGASSWFFRTPDGGESELHFGYVEGDDAMRDRYQGAAWQYVAVDELTQWRESEYTFLFSRARPSSKCAKPIPVRVRGTTNPGNRGHDWVKARFIERARHVGRGSDARQDIQAFAKRQVPMPSPRLYVSPPSQQAEELARETGRRAQGAYFVPAFASDNPGLDVAAYRANLVRLLPLDRERLDHGDWDASDGGTIFKDSHFEIVDSLPIVGGWLRSWDTAATEPDPGKDPDFTCGTRMAIWRDDRGVKEQAPDAKVIERVMVNHVETWRSDVASTEARILRIARGDGPRVRQLFEQEPGSAGKFVTLNWKRALIGQIVDGFAKTGPKQEYWRPLASYAEHTPILVLRAPWNEAWIRALVRVPAADHDDEADSISQGFAHLTVLRSGAARQAALAAG